MSFWSYRKAVFESELASTTKLVLLCLDHHVNSNGDPAWPSVQRLVDLTSLSRRTILEHLKVAEETGWIAIERRTEQSGRKTSSLYTLTTAEARTQLAEISGSEGSPDCGRSDGAAGAPTLAGDGAANAPTMVQQVHHWNRPKGKCVPVLDEQVLDKAQARDRVASIPLVDGTEFEVDEVLTQELQVAYPATDALLEIGKMRAWCLTNPKKRKTKRGILRFVNSWLSQCQDRGGSLKANGGGQKQQWLDTLLGRNGHGSQHVFEGEFAERVG